MVRWDLASVVVAMIALIVTVNPQSLRLLAALYRKIIIWTRPDRGTCFQLLWDDLHETLHNHIRLQGQDVCDYCGPFMGRHVNLRLCWAKTTSTIFNNVRLPKSRGVKPSQLPLDWPFLRTEARVILAYLITTVRCHVFDIDQYLEIRRQGTLIICHVKQANRVLLLTREEVDPMLEGWPPFYRKSFVTPEGHTLQSPTTGFKLLNRPGWIAAIGLGYIQPADICINPRVFDMACARFKGTIQEVFLKTWPNDPDVLAAKALIVAILRKRSLEETGYRQCELNESRSVVYPQGLQGLTKEQCEVTMEVFNTISINENQKRILAPVLKKVLYRVILGFAAADDYKRTSDARKMTIPKLLRGDGTIYLRDCHVEQ